MVSEIKFSLSNMLIKVQIKAKKIEGHGLNIKKINSANIIIHLRTRAVPGT